MEARHAKAAPRTASVLGKKQKKHLQNRYVNVLQMLARLL